jgi:hypothetical protein
LVIGESIFQSLDLMSRIQLKYEFTLERILKFDVDCFPHESNLTTLNHLGLPDCLLHIKHVLIVHEVIF